MTDIDVRTNVSIAQLVPVENEKEIAELALRIEAALGEEASVRGELDSAAPDVRAAVETKLLEVSAHLTAASSTLAAQDIDAAKDESDAAHAILGDIRSLLSLAAGGTATGTGTTTP